MDFVSITSAFPLEKHTKVIQTNFKQTLSLKRFDKELTIKYLTNANFIFVDIKSNDTIIYGQSFVSRVFKI